MFKKLVTDFKIFKIYMVIQILVQTVLVPVVPWLGVIGNAIIATWALCIIVYDYFNDKILFTSKIRFLLYLFVISVFVSIFINRVNLLDNLQTSVFLIIELFILFSAVKVTSEDLHKDLFKFSNFVGFTVFLGSLVGFTTYCLDIVFYLYSNRYCGIYSNPNMASVISLIGVALSALALCYGKNLKSKKSKIIYKTMHIISIVLNFVMFTFANSNNGKIMMFLFFASAAFVSSYLILKWKSSISKFLISFVIAALIGASSLGVFVVAQYSFANLPVLIDTIIVKITNPKEEDQTEPNKAPNFDREQASDGIDNGRFAIWSQGINAYKHQPIFGFGPRNVLHALEEHNPEVHESVDVGGLHNMFVELLVTCGAVGFLLFMLFFITAIFKVIKYVFDKKTAATLSRQGIVVLSVVIGTTVMLIAMNFGESIMLFSTTPYAMVLWAVFGYLYNFIRFNNDVKLNIPQRKGINKWM